MKRKLPNKKVIVIVLELLLALGSISNHCVTTVQAAPVQQGISPQATPWPGRKHSSFKVVIVKRHYHLYQGAFANKRTSSKYFQQTFNVNRTFTRQGQKYYWLNHKGQLPIGYINQKAVVKPEQTKLIQVQYVSQYVPVKTPWGCAGASLAMMLSAKGQKITAATLQKIQNHLPMQPIKGGQKGNVYTGVGFGHVIRPGALTRYAHTFKNGKRIINLSSHQLTVKQLQLQLQGGNPVLYYGFSSYQKPGDMVRNHCKVLTGYKHGYFRVYDPLYYSKYAGPGTGGKNMAYDHGAIAWISKKTLKQEFCQQALTFK